MSTHLTTSYISGNLDVPFKEVLFWKAIGKAYESRRNDKIFSFFTVDDSKEVIHYTYERLYRESNLIASSLYTLFHLNRKDVCGVYLPNSPEYIVSQVAIQGNGFIMMQVNTTQTKDQLQRLVPRLNPKAIITSIKLMHNIRFFDKAIPLILVDVNKEDVTELREREKHIYSIQELLEQPLDEERLNKERTLIEPDDDIYYGCTSGSTGIPKICVYTNKNWVGNILTLTTNFQSQTKKVLSFSPMFTNLGNILISCCVLRNTFYCFMDKFYLPKLFQIIEQERITSFSGAPSVMLAMMKFPDRNKYDVSSLREVSVGGAPSTNDFLETFKETFGIEYVGTGYGMTELCGAIYLLPARSCGRKYMPYDHYELRVVDKKTREVVGCGKPGELEVRSPIMMKEYLNNPEANKESFTDDRWFKTGDEAILENDGWLTISGRIKDMIIRGSTNIWPNEIVDSIIKHPKIKEASVVGIEDRLHSESIIAFVVGKDGCDISDIEEEIKEFLKDKIVPIAIPNHVFVLNDLPKTGFGKVYNLGLKEMIPKLLEDKYNKMKNENTDVVCSELGIKIALIWSSLLGIPIESISRNEQFKNIGGDSFVSSMTVNELKKLTTKNVPINILDTCPTIASLEQRYLTNN